MATSPSCAHMGAFPIEALPTDLLIEVFRFLPVRARLNALGLVCKRWRSVTLRTVRRLAITGPPEADEDQLKATVGASLSLFPCLTSLSLTCTEIYSLRLPTSLTHLHLEAGVRADLFSMHFPNLAVLSLDVSIVSEDSGNLGALITDFIVRHCSTLQKLDLSHSSILSDIHDVYARVAQAGLPSARKLKLRGPVEDVAAVIQSAPRLQWLELLLPASDLLSLPETLLTALRSWITYDSAKFAPDVVARLQRLPLLNVQAFSDLPDELNHLVAATLLDGQTPWESLLRHPHLREVTIGPNWAGEISHVLPRLCAVNILCRRGASTANLLALASSVLAVYRSLKSLSIVLQATQYEAMEELCLLGIRYGLRHLSITGPLKVAVPTVVKCGWLRARIICEPDIE